MPVFVTVIILLLILGLVGFAAGVRKLRIDRGTIEHVSRELLIRLEAMEDRMERNERSLAGSLSGVREELRLSLQEAREEMPHHRGRYLDRSQRRGTNEVADDDTVRKVVKRLQQIGPHDRQCKKQYGRPFATIRHIVSHANTPESKI